MGAINPPSNGAPRVTGGNAVPKPTVTTSPTGSPVLSAHAAHQLHVVHMAHLAHLAHTPNAKTI